MQRAKKARGRVGLTRSMWKCCRHTEQSCPAANSESAMSEKGGGVAGSKPSHAACYSSCSCVITLLAQAAQDVTNITGQAVQA